jgi:hypothetical protein
MPAGHGSAATAGKFRAIAWRRILGRRSKSRTKFSGSSYLKNAKALLDELA